LPPGGVIRGGELEIEREREGLCVREREREGERKIGIERKLPPKDAAISRMTDPGFI
jgi:hypothetical protein